MPTADDNWLTDEIVQAVCRHMNDDHEADNLLIVKAFGGFADAVSATLSSLDLDSAYFTVELADSTASCPVPWSSRLADRAQIRAEMVEFYLRAAEQQGVTARSTAEH